MYAIIETGGKQYRVQVGDTIFVEKLDVEAEDNIVFDKVLAVVDEGNCKFGTPTIKSAKVEAKVIKNGKAKKVIVYKMRPKKNYRRKQGHRQPYTKVEISAIKF